jgi:hypothetical protein
VRLGIPGDDCSPAPAPRQTSQTVGAISGEGCFSVLRIREHAEAAHNEGYRKGGPIGGLLRLRPRALLPLKNGYL